MNVHDFTIYDFICRNAELNEKQDCLVFKERRLSFGDYKEKCDQLAAGLTKAGIVKGDRIGVVAYNSDDYMILFGASAKIGAIVLAVNWRFQPEEVEYVLKDCTPKMVFAGESFQETVATATENLASVEGKYLMGEGNLKEGFTDMVDLFLNDIIETEIDISADDGCVIIHTAAVEGHPRGALLSQANLVYNNLLTMLQCGLNKNDCNIGFLPLFHVAGLTNALAVMHVGGKNVIAERFDAEETLTLIEKEKGTIFFNFAPILGMIMDKYEEGNYDISSMKHVAGIDSPENIKRFMKLVPGCTCYTGFAQTEAMGVSRAPIMERPGCAGKPSVLTKVKLFDDYDKEVPVGTPGEICVRSPTVFLGYWGLEEDTAYTFRNGWHHTGDIGKFDEDGYLWYVKRKAQKELIKPGGENVYPAEVEKTILEHESVKEVSVIGVPDAKWGEAIKAICVLVPGKSLEAGKLIEFVGSKIARYKKPQQVVFVDSLPKLDSGEVDRDQVKKDHGGKF
ncbi:AMP-binding protein [bacterium]|nr:AMP-binding protein [bacterium]